MDSAIRKALSSAANSLPPDVLAGDPLRADPELRSTNLDITILESLGKYHADKTRAATAFASYRRTGEFRQLVAAHDFAFGALARWEDLAGVAAGYHGNLVFGYDAERAPPIGGAIRAHTGHWRDRLPEVRADFERLQQLLAEANAGNAPPTPARRLPNDGGPRPSFQHERAVRVVAGRSLELRAKVEADEPLRAVLLHHRPMDQTQDWQTIPMTEANGAWTATIPGEAITARFDHLYYLEARTSDGGALWPNWLDETPYVVVSTTAP